MSFFKKGSKGRVKKPLFMALYSGPGLGKCFEPSTEVLMYNGDIKKIKDISIGDKVMGPDSKPRKVLSISRGESKLFKVSLKKGDSFICNDKHLIYGQNKRFKDFKIEASELAKLSKSQVERYKILRTGVEFREKKLSVDPYFVGIWLGDGIKSLKILGISNPDREVKTYLKKFCKNNGLNFNDNDGLNMRLTAYKRGESTRRHPVTPKLRKFVIDGEKRIDKKYLINSRKNRMRLLAGLLDSDGYLINKVFEITTQYYGLSKDIIFLAKSLGYQATVRDKIVKGKILYC